MARIWPAVRWVTPETLEAPPGFEPGNKGFAGLCLTAWLRRQKQRGAARLNMTAPLFCRAGNRTRTGDPHLGKVVLYQLSYSREKNKVLWIPTQASGKRFRNTPRSCAGT